MSKKLDLNKTVYELVQEYPELVEIMFGLGFTEITKKPILNSVGKLMTIPKGAKMKNISMLDIISEFTAKGFEIVGDIPDNINPVDHSVYENLENKERTEQLKTYLRRLGNGEDLEKVRADFVKEFEEVEASEIMQAEQELLKEGTPLSEVQKLCDIHSALFHGATTEERIANAEKAVRESILRKNGNKKENNSYEETQATKLEGIQGHPLNTLKKENDELAILIEKFRESRDEKMLPKLREVSIHYAKKGDLLYPLLKVKYGITGPASVMWTVDDEIRDELGSIAKETNHNEEWHNRLDAVLERAEEMIYKEQNILFPICAEKFTIEEWYGIYKDSKDYSECFDVHNEVWEEAENTKMHSDRQLDGEIVMSGGHMTLEQLTELLNTLPFEITFVDADNINRFFNEGEKVFKRPSMAIDRDVFSCHPPKIEPMVRKIIDDFRNNLRNEVSVWLEKNERTMLVKYMAVRDRGGNYIGTVEIVQDMEFAREYFCK